ncbi:restriction endonuclease subunit S [Psychrobacter maritimus]|uniref:restriction endonuclease subunit S n=1 Tax=Psychrobacter maritimus TaxID=256325 RepID=UPI003FD4650E
MAESVAKYQRYEEYRNSGVEWLGQVPTHWGTKPLKYLCTYNDEVLPDSTSKELELEYVDIGSVSSTEGITNTENMVFENAPSRAKRIVQDGDVIISTVRTYLEAIAPINNPPENMIVSTGFAVIRPNEYLYKGYAAYCLRAKGFIKEVVSLSVGVSYPAINATDLVSINIPSLPFNEQTQIANFLDHETAQIDTLIEKQQTLIQLLKEKRQAVISHAVTKGLNPDAPMKESGVEWLGEVPEHWKVAKLKFYTNQIVDGAHFTPTYTDKGIPFLRVTDIHNDSIDMNSIKYIPRHEHEALIKRCNPQKGDLLLSKNGTIGIPKVIDWEWEFSIFVSLCLIKFKETLTSHYAEYFFKSHEIKEQISGLVKQSTVINLHLDKIQNFWFAIPPVSEQHETVNVLNTKIEKFDGLIGKAEKAIQLMQERRTALISAAVTGKIDVRGWVAPE